MGNIPGGAGAGGQGGGGGKKQKKKEWKPPKAVRTGKRRHKGAQTAEKLPQVYPNTKCRLRQIRLDRVKDFLLLEEEYLANQETLNPRKNREKNAAEELAMFRPLPLSLGTLEEIVDDDHAIVSLQHGSEIYTYIHSFVNKDLLEPGTTVLLASRGNIVGIMADNEDSSVNVMKVDKTPLETYADIGGLQKQIQEVKESVELPLTHPELYEDMGISPPKGCIFYGPPGTGKTLLAKAVAAETSATFLRMVGSELIQKYLGDGPKLVRELFRTANEQSPSIVFIDEIDAVGTKRYDSNSGAEREIQRTMLELLNQLDGFDANSEVKVVMATNRIETLDPALLRPGRMDRKILFPPPDLKTKRRIFQIHTSKMSLANDVNVEELVTAKEELSGADVKAICTEAGLLALRERRMRVCQADFIKAKETALYRKKSSVPQGLFL